MRTLRIVCGLLAIVLVFGTGGLQAAGKQKVKATRPAAAAAGVAGAISSPSTLASRPRVIDSNDGQGYYCTWSTPNVHYLGTLPPETGVVIDFESSDTSDPIAILTVLKMEGMDLNAETMASDDADDLLNPRFESRKPYWATYILAVSTANVDAEACYAYRMRIVP
jgi:hypothetical protein